MANVERWTVQSTENSDYECSALGRQLYHTTITTIPKAQREPEKRDSKNVRNSEWEGLCEILFSGCDMTVAHSTCYDLTQDLCKIKLVKISYYNLGG